MIKRGERRGGGGMLRRLSPTFPLIRAGRVAIMGLEEDAGKPSFNAGSLSKVDDYVLSLGEGNALRISRH